MNDTYILDGKKPIAEQRFGTSNRQVAEDFIGDIRISTVFLGIDHSFFGGEPVLFETMVFGGPLDGEEQRYHTWKEAEHGHAEMVNRVKRISIRD